MIMTKGVVAECVSVLVPTMGRPELLKRMLDSIERTSKGEVRVEVLVYLEEDDTSDYSFLFDYPMVEIFRGSGKTVGQAWNIMAAHCSGDLIMMGNDDLVWHTEGWDVRLTEIFEEYPDQIFCAWFNDQTKNSRAQCAFPIVSRRWYNTLGYFTPEVFEFFYHDTWVRDVAQRVGRLVYIEDFVVEHRHFTEGKASMDETYAVNRRGGIGNRDRNTYANSVLQRKRDASQLQIVMEE
jgi:glycosyltransferase involved in cell wall biosynthesis